MEGGGGTSPKSRLTKVNDTECIRTFQTTSLKIKWIPCVPATYDDHLFSQIVGGGHN